MNSNATPETIGAVNPNPSGEQLEFMGLLEAPKPLEQALEQETESADEPLTEVERAEVERLRLERENYDEEADIHERVENKMQLLGEHRGLAVTFSPDEAEHIGAFEETAMSYEDAWASRFDDIAP